jgi:rubrerythrin
MCDGNAFAKTETQHYTWRGKMTEKMDLEQAWRMAIQREQEAREDYEELLGMVDSSALKNLFTFLIEQEKNHKRLLQEEYERYFTPEN